ncbi:MAG: hypothetical protein GX020_00510 [Firmicutes bacterium]|nr:hypothetical protein [Bacillota bacterium]
MGIRNECCFCPCAWEAFINDWAYIYTVNDDAAFGGVQWQLRQVQDTFIIVRRWTQDLGWQRAVIPCRQIVALVEALPDPPPVNTVNGG